MRFGCVSGSRWTAPMTWQRRATGRNKSCSTSRSSLCGGGSGLSAVSLTPAATGGNAVCEGKGRSARFQCPYHNWSYGLDGKLLAVAKPDYDGPVEEFVGRKEDLGLVQVPVECFAGFVFLNPDPDAPPLLDYLGEVADLLAPYRMEEMIPVGLNMREAIEGNWKVVMDAFQESYHV